MVTIVCGLRVILDRKHISYSFKFDSYKVRIASSKTDLFSAHVGIRFVNHRILSLLFADDDVLLAVSKGPSSCTDLHQCEVTGMKISLSNPRPWFLTGQNVDCNLQAGREPCLKSISGSSP